MEENSGQINVNGVKRKDTTRENITGTGKAWMEKLANDLRERDANEPYIPTLYCNNQSTNDWMKESKFHAKSKHIEIRYYYIRNNMVDKKRLIVQFIPGKD